MANDDEKKPKLANTSITNYPYGDLNPVFVKETSPRIDDDETFFGILKRSARLVHTPDARVGTGPYKGIVLRRNKDITSVNEIPADSWLANFPTRFSANTVLQSYQVFIPELHSHLPEVKTYAPVDTDCDEHVKIDLYPTFISKDPSVKPAVEGSIVWVDYGNTQTFQDPVYLGPVDGITGPIDFGQCKISAKEAMKKSCGKPPNAAPGAEATGEFTMIPEEQAHMSVLREEPISTDMAQSQVQAASQTATEAAIESAMSRVAASEAASAAASAAAGISMNYADDAFIHPQLEPIPITGSELKSRKQKLLRDKAKVKQSKRKLRANPRTWAEQSAETNAKLRAARISIGLDPDTGKRPKGIEDYETTPEEVETSPTPEEVEEVAAALDKEIAAIDSKIKEVDKIKQIKTKESVKGAAKEKECPDCPKHGEPPTERPTMKKVKVTLDVANYGGRTNGTMTAEAREDVAQAFTKARKIVNELGGIIAGGGGKAGPFGRSLSNFPKESESGKSKTSYHYLYKALDMQTECSTNNAHPANYGIGVIEKENQIKYKDKNGKEKTRIKITYTIPEPFKWDVKKIYKQKEYFIVKGGINKNGKRMLRVWAKSKKPAGTSFGGYRVERKTLRVLMCSGGAKRFKNKGPDTIKITGNFIDLTQIMLDHGFQNISPVGRWWTACGGSASNRPRAEWWHFHIPEPPETKFGDALLSVYSDEEVQCKEPWRYRNFVLRNGAFEGAPTDKGCA